jgi:hypothetical protein
VVAKWSGAPLSNELCGRTVLQSIRQASIAVFASGRLTQQLLVQALVTHLRLKLLTCAFSIGLPGRMRRSVTQWLAYGRAMRGLGSDLFTSMVMHSSVTSSTMFSVRNATIGNRFERRPSATARE